MKEYIDFVLKKTKRPINFEKIVKLIEDIKRGEDSSFDSLSWYEKKEIEELLVEGTLNYEYFKTDDDNYILLSKTNYRHGIFNGTKNGDGYVSVVTSYFDKNNQIVVKEEKYDVSKNDCNGAIDGDSVLISIGNGKHHRICEVLDRNLDYLAGEVFKIGSKCYVKAVDKRKQSLTVVLDHDAIEGQKVLVRLKKSNSNNFYTGDVVKVFGHKNDPDDDILWEAYKLGIDPEFSDEALKELEYIPDHVRDVDKIGRMDLTNWEVFTIDGDDTKDIDDALSIKKLDNGNYLVGVHIADVSHYVKYDTALYKEAFARGTSSYLANTVIPMIPHQLSNGICSLNPDVVRLTISCVMEVDGNGNALNSEIFESYIKSRKQMTYKNVNKILEENTVPSGYEEFKDDLLLMKELADIVRKKKISKGYIEFDDTEPVIVTDDDGRAIDILKRERGAGEKLIEDFMILANETVASTISYMDLPFIYRVHGTPDEDKIKQFLGLTSILGYKVNASVKNITPKTIQSMLNQLRDKKEFPVLSSMLLRSMKKAVYDSINIGHFGLASKFYTHFTSPIRRFPDLTVHRLLRTYLFENKINNETVDYFSRELPLIAEQSSLRERAAVDCEREVDDMKMAEYMEGHIGEVYKGMISTVTNYGMYVIINGLIEGMIRVEDLTGDYYLYDESTYSLIGKSSKKRYMLGNMIDVEVTSVIKEKGLINLKLFEGDKGGNKQQKSKI